MSTLSHQFGRYFSFGTSFATKLILKKMCLLNPELKCNLLGYLHETRIRSNSSPWMNMGEMGMRGGVHPHANPFRYQFLYWAE